MTVVGDRLSVVVRSSRQPSTDNRAPFSVFRFFLRGVLVLYGHDLAGHGVDVHLGHIGL
jgi:hypothetical protein